MAPAQRRWHRPPGHEGHGERVGVCLSLGHRTPPVVAGKLLRLLIHQPASDLNPGNPTMKTTAAAENADICPGGHPGEVEAGDESCPTLRPVVDTVHDDLAEDCGTAGRALSVESDRRPRGNGVDRTLPSGAARRADSRGFMRKALSDHRALSDQLWGSLRRRPSRRSRSGRSARPNSAHGAGRSGTAIPAVPEALQFGVVAAQGDEMVEPVSSSTAGRGPHQDQIVRGGGASRA